jgi:hypothetical protein
MGRSGKLCRLTFGENGTCDLFPTHQHTCDLFPTRQLERQHLLSEEEMVASCSLPLPLPRRVTAQIMRHWKPHLTAQEEPPSARCKHLRMLHSKVTVNAILRVPEGAPGHSILQYDMLDEEEPDCEEIRKHKLVHGPLAHPTCLFRGKSRTDVR